MKIFVTGATGYIGAAVAEALLARGHRVLGLSRSVESAGRMRARGIEPWPGNLDDTAGLRRAAGESDGVVHTAFNYDNWSAIPAAFEQEHHAVSAMLEGLAGTGRPFVYTSGTGTLGDTGKELAPEQPVTDPAPFVRVRAEVENQVLGAVDAGVRGIVVRPGLVYGRGGSGLLNALIQLSVQAGIGRTPGDGENAWSVVHVEDLGALYALAVEQAPPGTILHAVAGEPVRMRDIAAAISRAMGKGDRVDEWPLEAARAHFPMADVLASEKRVSAVNARALLGWVPARPSIGDEIEHGSYRAVIAPAAATQPAS